MKSVLLLSLFVIFQLSNAHAETVRLYFFNPNAKFHFYSPGGEIPGLPGSNMPALEADLPCSTNGIENDIVYNYKNDDLKTSYSTSNLIGKAITNLEDLRLLSAAMTPANVPRSNSTFKESCFTAKDFVTTDEVYKTNEVFTKAESIRLINSMDTKKINRADLKSDILKLIQNDQAFTATLKIILENASPSK